MTTANTHAVQAREKMLEEPTLKVCAIVEKADTKAFFGCFQF